MRNLAWAFSLNTVQYMDGCIYGATVLEGNILRVKPDGEAEIVWYNDNSDALTGGIFLYSIIVDEKLYFFPYASDYIVIYVPKTHDVQKIFFRGKRKKEKIYPHIYCGKILMFGLDSGCVWKLSEEITPIYTKKNSIGILTKYRCGAESRYVFFCDEEIKQIVIFDCKENIWLTLPTKEYVKNGYADDKYAWYIVENCVHRREIESDQDAEAIEAADSDMNFVELSQKKLMISDVAGNHTFILDKKTMKAESVETDTLLTSNRHFIIPLGETDFFLADIEALDWMLWAGDRYALCDATNMSVCDIPMFHMEEKTGRVLTEKYIQAAWNSSQDRIRFENEKESISFLLETLKYEAGK